MLDIACGTGNATIAAARNGASTVGVDYVPAMLEQGRVRAAAEGLEVELLDGDAEDLPLRDDSFDATLSVFGTMFAPDHARTAQEMVRMTRSGGTIGLASWCPDGFLGDFLRAITAHVPPPPGVASPLLWGTESHLRELSAIRLNRSDPQSRCAPGGSRPQTLSLPTSASGTAPLSRRTLPWSRDGRDVLAADLVAAAPKHEREVGRSVAVPATYLQTIMQLR